MPDHGTGCDKSRPDEIQQGQHQVLQLGRKDTLDSLAGWRAALQKGPGVRCAKKVNSILGCISRSTAHRPRDTIIPLYSALVIVHLDTVYSFGSLDIRKYFFSMMRTTKQDNSLPREVAQSPLWRKLSAFHDSSGKNSEHPGLTS